MKSMPPPGARGTMKRTGLFGHGVCAIAGVDSRDKTPPANARLPTFLMKPRRPMMFKRSSRVLQVVSVKCDDCTLLLKRTYLLIVKSVFAQNAARMLTIQRRAGAHFTRRSGELDGKPERLNQPQRRVLGLDNHLARDRLGIGQRLQHVMNRTAGDALFLKRFEPIFCRLIAEVSVQLRREFLQMSHAVSPRQEAWIFGHFRY